MEWTDEMKSAAMADAALVCKQAEAIKVMKRALLIYANGIWRETGGVQIDIDGHDCYEFYTDSAAKEALKAADDILGR